MCIVNIIGRTCNDVEVRKTTTGTKATTITVAVNKGKDKTVFVNCVAFGSTVDFLANYFKKGDPIAINGTLDSYKTINGKTNYQVIIDNVYFVPQNKNANNDGVSSS